MFIIFNYVYMCVVDVYMYHIYTIEARVLGLLELEQSLVVMIPHGGCQKLNSCCPVRAVLALNKLNYLSSHVLRYFKGIVIEKGFVSVSIIRKNIRKIIIVIVFLIFLRYQQKAVVKQNLQYVSSCKKTHISCVFMCMYMCSQYVCVCLKLWNN